MKPFIFSRFLISPKMLLSCLIVASFLTPCSVFAQKSASPEIVLARKGKALLSVIVATNATERVRVSAFELAQKLGRMGRCQFEVREGDGSRGIVVGRAQDFPAVPFVVPLDSSDIQRQEEYVLKSRKDGLYLLGASDLAVESGTWDLLHRLGYRHFFPHPNWEVVPEMDELRLTIDAFEAPDFLNRHLWTGHGTLPVNSEHFTDWLVHNRARAGFPISSSHIYGSILSSRRAIFNEHPEYLGLLKGKRVSSKFCISNPGLRQVVVDCLDYFKENPEKLSISMEPSDGGDWCECEACAALGSISDRMILLCNTVAEAVNEKYPGKLVGTLSYYLHTDPPSFDVHPNVAVTVTMGLRTGSLSTEELIAGWRAKGVRHVGLSYNVGGPSAMRDLPRVASEFRYWHKLGINRFVIDMSDEWGKSGLGNYLLARVLWDVEEGDRLDELLDDFFERAFGVARAPMETWFNLTYRMKSDEIDLPLTEDRLGRMYRALADAYKLAKTEEVRNRIGDLAIYTRILELQHEIGKAEGNDARERASAAFMRFIYRTQDRELVHAKRMFVYPRFYTLYGYQTTPVHQMPEGLSPWKDVRPCQAAELLRIVSAGVQANAISDITVQPVPFSRDLVPARDRLQLPAKSSTHLGRGDNYYGQRFYTWVEKAPGEVRLRIRSGRADGGSPKVTLYTALEVTLDAVDSDRSTPAEEGSVREVVLKTSYAGLHWVDVDGGGVGNSVTLVDPMAPRTSEGRIGNSMWGFPAWSLVFYVPKGTQTVGGFSETGRGIIRDADGRMVFIDGHFPTEDQRKWGMGEWTRWRNEREKAWEGGYFSIPVLPGQDGRLWDTMLTTRRWYLLTVPPYFAETADQLMLPREVVERDAPKK